MLLCFRVTVLLGHSKIDNVNNIGSLGTRSSDEEIIRFDITVYEVPLMDSLNPRQLYPKLEVKLRYCFFGEIPFALPPLPQSWLKTFDGSDRKDPPSLVLADQWPICCEVLPGQNSRHLVFRLKIRSASWLKRDEVDFGLKVVEAIERNRVLAQPKLGKQIWALSLKQGLQFVQILCRTHWLWGC